MYTNAQNQQILRILAKALDLNSFVSNQYLVSQLVPKNQWYTLPISVFLAFPEFITMQLTEEDIIDSCQSFQSFNPLENYIYIPYPIYPSMLVMKEFCSFANAAEILSYIKSLVGNELITIHKLANNIAIIFQNIENCIIFWRGTKYFPFKGTIYIESQIYSHQLYQNIPFTSLQEDENNFLNQSEQMLPKEQQRNQNFNSQYNDNYKSSNQNYQQKKSPRQHNYRYQPKPKHNDNGGSPRQSQSQRGMRNRDQQHRQPQTFLRTNPRQQPNPPVQYQQPNPPPPYQQKPLIQARSNSQPPLILSKPQQQQPQNQQQLAQSQQTPQTYNRNYYQNQQQQEQKEQPPPPPPPQQQQQQQQQQANNTPKSKQKKYYRNSSKKQNQKK